MQLIQLERVERNIMIEWTTNFDKIIHWFNDTEELLQKNNKIDDVHLYLVKFEVRLILLTGEEVKFITF